jgi:regulator of sirC expression with transglutaminase-like and TPR domain
MILVRVLNNLKVVYAKQSAWGAAWQVQHRLAALHPGSYAERRDLGILSLHAGRAARAIDLLGGCLRCCPDDERDVLEEHLQLARKQLAHWN